MRICGCRFGFFHTAPNILIPPVISGIPTQSYPRKPWKRGQFSFQEPRGLTFSGRMCEGSERSFQFNVWAQETQEKGKACPPGAFRGKMTHTGWERSQDKKSHLSLLCAGTRTEHSITGWREGADLFASSRTWQAAGVMRGTAWVAHVPRRRVEMSLQLAHFPQGTEEADGGIGGAWKHQMVLRTCLESPLANTILAMPAVRSRPHSGCIPWDTHFTPLPSHVSACEGEIRQRRGNNNQGFPATVVCSSQLLNFHNCNFLDLWR